MSLTLLDCILACLLWGQLSVWSFTHLEGAKVVEFSGHRALRGPHPHPSQHAYHLRVTQASIEILRPRKTEVLRSFQAGKKKHG